MEGVVRVSSADTNDRRNRWETGNGGRGGGEQGKNEHVLGSWAPRTKTTENERIPLPLSLSRSLVGPCRRLVGQQLPFTSPPLLGGKVGQIGKVRFPRRTTLSCTHARRFVTSFLPTSFVFSFGKQRFSRVFFRALRSTAVL